MFWADLYSYCAFADIYCSKRSYNDVVENNCCKDVLSNIRKHRAQQIRKGRDLALHEWKVHTHSYFEKTNSFLFKWDLDYNGEKGFTLMTGKMQHSQNSLTFFLQITAELRIRYKISHNISIKYIFSPWRQICLFRNILPSNTKPVIILILMFRTPSVKLLFNCFKINCNSAIKTAVYKFEIIFRK